MGSKITSVNLPRPLTGRLSSSFLPLRLYSLSARPILFCTWPTHSSYVTVYSSPYFSRHDFATSPKHELSPSPTKIVYYEPWRSTDRRKIISFEHSDSIESDDPSWLVRQDSLCSAYHKRIFSADFIETHSRTSPVSTYGATFTSSG